MPRANLHVHLRNMLTQRNVYLYLFSLVVVKARIRLWAEIVSEEHIDVLHQGEETEWE